MNLFSLLPGILKTVGNALGIGIFKDAASTLEKVQLTPEQQVALQTALAVHEEAMAHIRLDELKTVMSESLAEIQSSDKFVARARPAGLYLAYLVSLGLAGAMIAGIKLDPTAILTLCGPMYGAAGVYVYQRSQEKIAQLANGSGK